MWRVRVLGGLLLAWSVGACATGEGNPPETQVLPASDCPPERCADVEVALRETGWTFLEPTELPEGFDLYSRRVQRDPSSVEAGKSGHIVVQQFRFQGSANVPGIIVSQSRPLGDSAVIQPESAACGELKESALGPLYYASGLVRVEPVPDESLWLVCGDESLGHSQTHSVVMATGGVLVEIIAFPESGVSEDALLRLVDSLAPASPFAD